MRRLLFVVALTALFISLSHSSAVEIRADFEFHVTAVDPVLHPGAKIPFNVLIENAAKVSNLQTTFENLSQTVTILTTAKNVRVELQSGNLFEVENEEVVIGDLPQGLPRSVTFVVKVKDDVKEGRYSVPVRITYDRLRFVIESTNVIVNYDSDRVFTAWVDVKVEKKDYDVSLSVLDSELVAGDVGIVKIRVTNTGRYAIYNASLTVNATPPFKPEPAASFAYISDLKPGDSADAQFRLYVMNSAFLQSYPATFVVRFTTSDGKLVLISKVVGLRVESGIKFRVEEVEEYVTSAKTVRVSSKLTQPQLQLPPLMSHQQIGNSASVGEIITLPSRGYVKVRVTNEGRDADDIYALLNFDTPLLRAENTPYIGKLGKNESAIVTFYVLSKAPPGDYVGYVLLAHSNEFGDEVLSGKHYIRVRVTETPEIVVKNVTVSNVGVGLSGRITLALAGKAERVKLYMLASEPISVLSPEAYIDRLDGAGSASFMVKVDSRAIAAYYPVYLVEKFDRGEIKDLMSVIELAVPVQPKLAQFRVVDVRCELHPDSAGEVVLKIENAGSMSVYNAVAVLEVSTPLSVVGGSMIGSMLGEPQSAMYFIGTLKPGDVAEAKFRIDVSKDASEGSYPAALKLKYYDESGYEHESNSIVVPLEVTAAPPYYIVAAAIIALFAVAAAVKFIRSRKHAK